MKLFQQLWLIITVVVLGVSTMALGQDIVELTETYLELETRLTQAQTKQQHFIEMQRELIQRRESLITNKSWINGWLVEMRLAQISKSLISAADSLEIIQDQIDIFNMQQQELLQKFKVAYQTLLSQSRGDSVYFDSLRVNILAESFINNNLSSSAFPDYEKLVNALYSDKNVKKLVFQDLQKILRRKIVFIDSILAEKEKDLALVNRLEQFHKDLVIQSEANTDFNIDVNSGNLNAGETESGFNGNRYVPYSDGEPDSRGQSLISASWEEQTQEDIVSETPSTYSAGSLMGERSIFQDINLLRTKRAQYEKILDKIQKDLSP